MPIRAKITIESPFITDYECKWFAKRVYSVRLSAVEELSRLRNNLLSKKSQLGTARSSLATLPLDQRREIGAKIELARKEIESALAERRQLIEVRTRKEKLAADEIDITEWLESSTPARGHQHIVQRTRDELEDVFVGMGFSVNEGPEVETDWYNFEALNIPPAHPARGMWDTFYLDLGEPETVLLRTHTSPTQIRGMVHPAVFEAVGIDSKRWTGFAFGFGIDRCAQMRYQIPDMRVLMENDYRFMKQL